MLERIWETYPIITCVYGMIGSIFYAAARLDRLTVLQSAKEALFWPLSTI